MYNLSKKTIKRVYAEVLEGMVENIGIVSYTHTAESGFTAFIFDDDRANAELGAEFLNMFFAKAYGIALQNAEAEAIAVEKLYAERKAKRERERNAERKAKREAEAKAYVAQAQALAQAKAIVQGQAQALAKSARAEALQATVEMFRIAKLEYGNGELFNIVFKKKVKSVSEEVLNNFFNGLIATLEKVDLRKEKENK